MQSDSWAEYSTKRLGRLLQQDFFPEVNVYVYWLKQPVGWFIVALISSCLVGAFLSPMGWTIAAGLSAILALGLGFPWLATHTLACQLGCISEELYEGEETQLLLSVRNPLPFPIVGLVIENYFQAPSNDGNSESPANGFECALARIPALSAAEYRLPIQPPYRGRYPNCVPQVACSFPFGIYTSRRSIDSVASVLVRPLRIPLKPECEISGDNLAYVGEGDRPSHHGDFVGVREFRRGDSLKSIHWVQSAKLDELVVCERGGPQKSPFTIRLITNPCAGSQIQSRENLAWRVRIAATLADVLDGRNIPFQLQIDDDRLPMPVGGSCLAIALDHLALIPLDGAEDGATPGNWFPTGDLLASVESGIAIGCLPPDVLASPEQLPADQVVTMQVKFGKSSCRSTAGDEAHLIDLEQSIDAQIEDLLREATHDCAA